MIAAIYARKSTDQNGVGDEEKSVTRQIEHAGHTPHRRAGPSPSEYIYVDDGISGAEFVKRPVPTSHERAQAEARVPDPGHGRGISARP